MYKLLIVDDEYQTRRGLCELLDWEAMNITVVADASDGDEALPLLEELHPDILLTDVRMHRMDGLELARKARQLLPGIGIVFISGYSDAEYLRDALHVGASDYIYKPIHLDELQNTMKRLTDRLSQQAETRMLLEKSKPLLAERFLRSWFQGLMDDKQSIRSKMDLIGLHFPEEGGIFAAVFQPEWQTFPENGQAENCQITLETCVRSGMENILTCAEENGIIALISAANYPKAEQLEEKLIAIRNQAQTEIATPVVVGVSQWHEDWLDAPVAVQEAMHALAHQAFPKETRVLFYEGEPSPLQPAGMLLDGDLLERYVLSGNIDMVNQMLDELIKKTSSDAQHSRKLLMSAMLRADLALQQQGLDVLDSLSFCKQAMNYQSVFAIKNALSSMLQKACAAITQRKTQAYSPVVERVLDIIRTDYAEHLSVNAIAERVHYSPAHLSTLFRKETGITLSEAILRTRLTVAMDLLRTTLEPVSVVAGRAGYADVQYFSRVFKQFTGFTPLEYRRKAFSC